MSEMTANGRTAAVDWPRRAPTLLALACLGALAASFIAQYVFGYQPCILCYYQRAAYAVAGVAAAAAVVSGARPSPRAALTALAGAVLFVGAGIAAYHVGVEHHWWGSAFCAANPAESLSTLSLDDVKRQLATSGEKPCDIVDWTLFGVSIATYNVGAFLGLGAAAIAAAGALWRRLA